jgi:lysosome membrane protein 2
MRYFDVQNVEALLNGERPVVVEVGPYTYTEYFYKFDISWDDHGDTVTYNTQRYYVFNPEQSGAGLKDTDVLTLIYPTVLGFEFLLGKVEKAYPGINAILDQFILVRTF